MKALLLQVSDDLMSILFLVLTTRDVNPEVFAVGGLDDGLVEVRVGGEELEPAVEDVLVAVRLVVFPIGVGSLGDVDVCCFTECVLAGVCSSDLDVESIAAIAGTDDDGLTCKSTQGFEDGLAELLQGRNEL